MDSRFWQILFTIYNKDFVYTVAVYSMRIPFQTGWFIFRLRLAFTDFLQHYKPLLGNVMEPEVPEDEPTCSKHVGRSVKSYKRNEVDVVDGVQWIITVVNNVCVSAYSTAGNVRVT